ncbi:MAG: zf-HC2 domain-containing protein [Spirochaetales bacterium]
MCPEKELLSMYVDGEVTQEDGIAITSHLETCSNCAGIVNRFIKIRKVLLHIGETLAENTPARETQMEQELIGAGQRISRELERYRRVPRPFWQKQVPLTWLATAASVAFLLGGALSVTLLHPRVSENSFNQPQTLNITIKVRNMQQLLEILQHQQGVKEITIQLPDTPQFEFRSEPVFIRAADFRGTIR